MKYAITIAAIISAVFLLFSAVLGGSITTIPGYNGPALSMNTGYINVNQQQGHNLFYWTIESESATSSTDPLVFWFQGGPGCSSLLGLFEENGPLRVEPDGSVSYTNISWTKFATMVWVESPVGVGFSYSTQQPIIVDDNSAAADNYAFLQGFFQQNPQYQGRGFWIIGESYGGVYVPMLTDLVTSNKNTALYNDIRGFMIGNGVIGCDSLWGPNGNNVSVQFNMLYWHGLVSYTLFSNWTSLDCDKVSGDANCVDIYNQAVTEIGTLYQQLEMLDESDALPSLDPDNLYQDFCTGNGTLEFTINNPSDCDPAGGNLVKYLNQASVQSAIGAQPADWGVCNFNLDYITSGLSMIPHYKNIFANKPSIKALIYSGDIDIMTVPFTFTQQCLSELNNSVKKSWKPWTVNGWTAGYVEEFQQFTFATVKGSGHEAPEYQPWNALNLFSRFLLNGNLDEESVEESQFRMQDFSYMRKISRQGQILREAGIV